MVFDSLDIKVISLPHRHDRREETSRALMSKGLAHEYVPGVFAPRCYPNTLGCVLAQLNALKAHTSGRDLLLLEDDAQLEPAAFDAFNTSQLPSDWGVLLLGGTVRFPRQENFWKVNHSWYGNHAVMYRKGMIEDFLKFSDTAIPFCNAEDYLFRFCLETRTPIYRYHQDVFYARSGFSDRLQANFGERRILTSKAYASA